MSLIKCAECCRDISTQAKVCPGCGAAVPKAKQKTSLATWVVTGCIGAGLIAAIALAVDKPTAPPAAPLSPAEQAAQTARYAKQSAAITVAKVIRDGMKDPQSFELKQLVVKDDGTGCYTIRGRNAFNAMLQSHAVLLPGKAPQLLHEDKDGNRFVDAWNKRCNRGNGEDITETAIRLMDR